MADHDPLTGLLNRRSFERELERHVAYVERYGPKGAAIVLDLDHFKTINDTLGHAAGDELIVRVAHALRGAGQDPVRDLGGDEAAPVVDQADGVAQGGAIGPLEQVAAGPAINAAKTSSSLVDTVSTTIFDSGTSRWIRRVASMPPPGM